MCEPRANRIHLPGLPDLTTELWMGGAHSPSGERVLPQDLAGAWVIDCAGDMPEDYRGGAAWWVTDPFQDYEELPVCWERATGLARSIGSCLRGASADEEQAAAHPEKPPPRLYVFCNQGMNRSGLTWASFFARSAWRARNRCARSPVAGLGRSRTAPSSGSCKRLKDHGDRDPPWRNRMAGGIRLYGRRVSRWQNPVLLAVYACVASTLVEPLVMILAKKRRPAELLHLPMSIWYAWSVLPTYLRGNAGRLRPAILSSHSCHQPKVSRAHRRNLRHRCPGT